ncbi:tyrosine-type recombinase/integrase [bacterium]|nr:tyrosine-type recombinase/integrase [bacterium]
MDIETLAEAIAQKINQKSLPQIPFEKFCMLYMERHARIRKKTWKEDQSRLRLYLLPAFEGKLLLDITRNDIVELHASIGARPAPYAANRMLEQLGKMFKLAQLWGFYPEDRMLPTVGVDPFPETPRDVFVQKYEMDRLAKAIGGCRSANLRALFWLYLLTALRRSELMRAKWSDLDLERWELRVLHTKNGKPHRIPLPPEAMAILYKLPRTGTYIFPGQAPGTHISNSTVWKSWDRCRTRAGLKHVRIHDLRRTVASWMVQSGKPLSLIGKLLNHSSLRATEVYARLAQEDVREALADHAKRVSEYRR